MSLFVEFLFHECGYNYITRFNKKNEFISWLLKLFENLINLT